MSKTASLSTRASLLLRHNLTVATAIAFSLTFLAGGVAVLLGFVPPRHLMGIGEIDTGVIMLFVPLSALLLAILVEVARSIVKEGLQPARPARQVNPLAAWKPGHGEG